MWCPSCKKELHCGCKSCLKQHAGREGNLVVHYDSAESESCPHCNYRQTIHFWYDWQFSCLEKDDAHYVPPPAVPPPSMWH